MSNSKLSKNDINNLFSAIKILNNFSNDDLEFKSYKKGSNKIKFRSQTGGDISISLNAIQNENTDIFSETSSLNQYGGNLSETSSVTNSFKHRVNNFSETSDDNLENSNNKRLFKNGGNLSETSSVTNSFKQNGGVFSDTSDDNLENSNIKSLFKNSDNYSETSILPISQNGGKINNFNESDTLKSITEFNLNTESDTESELDLNIFTKLNKGQTGGMIGNNMKLKLKELGINSSSTSSLCE